MEDPNIKFTNINITSMSSNSGVFTGENSQSGWQVNRKCNTGFGILIGYNNLAFEIVNIINDNDIIDSYFSEHINTKIEPVLQS
jgi:glutamate dehydrogenase/leucine dehydrogenase